MARHTQLAGSLLLLAVPTILTILTFLTVPTLATAQHEEYEARAFESWLAGASCDELEDESLFLRRSLATRRQGLREWKMGLRVQLGHAHRRYSVRCIQGLRYWSYECLSIQRTMGVLRGALEDDELVSDTTEERGILAARREKIEERRARACKPEVPTGADEPTTPVRQAKVRAPAEDARLEIPAGRVKAIALQLDGGEVSGKRWSLKPGGHSLKVQLRAKLRMRTDCELSFNAEEGGDYLVTRRSVAADVAGGQMLIAWIARRATPDLAVGHRFCAPAGATGTR